MAYTFDQIFAADASTPGNVAVNSAVTIFAPGDATMTPITITAPDGSPLANPIPVNANGFASAFSHATLDRVAWKGGGFSGFFTSYEGLKNVATAAQSAAESAASTAGATATAAVASVISAADAAASSAADSAAQAASAAALVSAPADSAIAAAVNGIGTATKTALDATYVPFAVPTTTLVVKADGTGQFTSPKLANDSITDSGPDKPYVILVNPGEYMDSYDWKPKPYVTVRGTSKDRCILSYFVPVDSPDQAVIDRSTITITKTVTLENLTITIEGGRYAVHSEEAGANRDALHNVRNCRLIHKGHDAVNAWRTANPGSGLVPEVFNSKAAWGYGSGSGVEETFTDTSFESSYGPFYGHNNLNFDKPTLNSLTRCRITSTSATAGGVTINSLGSGQADTFTFTDCQLDTLYVYHTDTSWFVDTYADHLDFNIVLNRCNPVGYFDDSRGLALQVNSGFGDPGASSTVRMSGTAVPLIFGVPTYKDGTGDGGFFGYAYGSVDISGITLGFDAHPGNNTLGKRLGNRTGSPVTLSVWNQGYYQQDYTFSADYTAMTNQQIIDLVNAAWSGFTFATTNPSLDRYPKVLGSESTLVNSGAGIAKWSAVAYAAGGRQVRPMTLSDPATAFAGIALERIPAGKAGRILHEGIMHRTQLAGMSAATVTAGSTVYHSDTTAGQFDTTGTRIAGTGRAADWTYFKAAV